MKKKRTGLKITAVILSIAIVIIAGMNIGGKILESKEQKGMAAGYQWSKEDSFSNQNIKIVDAGDKDFKVLCLTDIHLKNYGTFAAFLGINYILDGASYIALKKLINEVQPDLITILGDTVCTMKNDIQQKKFVEFMDQFEIPWAPVFGNHDEEGRADKAKLCDVFSESKYCLFEYGPQDLHGAGNYVVNIERDEKAVYSLYMLDTGAKVNVNGEDHEDGINQNQVDWYKWNCNGINSENGYTVPNMAFFHIPLKQYETAEKSETYELGVHGEQTYSQYYDFGFFNEFKTNNGTHVFSGHDHNNNFVTDFEGVKLCYAQKSSYNCYFKSGMTGGTLITISPDNTVKTELVNF